MYTELEARVLNSPQMEGIVLRYGFFYGPNTWYDPQGGAADEVRRQQVPLVEQGQEVWSFVHVEDAALATVVALTAEPGTYNIVDNDPSPVSVWLPAFAQWVDAPCPPCLSEQEARAMGGEELFHRRKRSDVQRTINRTHPCLYRWNGTGEKKGAHDESDRIYQ